MLVKEAGFDLNAIRGTTTRHVEKAPATGMVASVKRWCPYLEDPDPVVTNHLERTEGMSEREVLRFMVYHDEIEEIKNEEQEDSMREARRKSGQLGQHG